MKRIIIVLFLINIGLVNGQTNCDNYCLSFDDSLCISHIFIDTANAPLNIWQIGRPQKPSLDTNIFNSRVIITDTADSYPAGNYSAFIITNLATMGDIYGFKMFSGNYHVETDSLKDYGKIEFSPDNGLTWIDLINDTTYSRSITWYSDKPVLTGHSGNNYKWFDVLLADNGSVFNIQAGDTLLYRFTFNSDSIFDNLSGLLFDNICFHDFVEGISETHFKPIKSKIFPNPSTGIFTIEFENSSSEIFQLAVYDIHSKLILTKENITDNKATINTQQYKQGMYVYKLTNLKSKKRSWGKFIKDD